MRTIDLRSDVCSSDLLSRAPIGNPVTDTIWLAVVGSRIKMLASNCVLAEVVEVTHFSARNASSGSDEAKRILKQLADDACEAMLASTEQLKSEGRRVGKECVSTCRYGCTT